MDEADGKEVSVHNGETGVENERIEDIKRQILKAALERVTSDPNALALEYYSAYDEKGKVYRGDILKTCLALSLPNTDPDKEGLAITLLSQNPRSEYGEIRETLGYALARAERGLKDADREVAVTEMRRVREGNVDNAVITRLHFADIGIDSKGKTINFGVTYKEDTKAENLPGSKLPSLWHRWREGGLQAGPTSHIMLRPTVEKDYPGEEDYARILDSLQRGVTDKKLTGKIVKSEEYFSAAKPVSPTQVKETNRILAAIKKRVPLLK